MIKITGTTRQTFSFPADVNTASAFYRNFAHILRFLPHIHLVRAYGPDQFRVLYHTLELSIYRVRIYCDLQVSYDEATHTLHTAPLFDHLPVKCEATVHSLTAQGYFNSQSIFLPHGAQSSVDYKLSLEARLPKPFGLMLMPDKVIQQIASNITEWRIHEIAGGFIKRSVQAYQQEQTAARPSELPHTAAAPRPRRVR